MHYIHTELATSGHHITWYIQYYIYGIALRILYNEYDILIGDTTTVGDTTILQLTRASRLAGVAGFNLACICAASAYSGRHIEVCNLKKYNSKVSYNFFVPI